MASKKSNEMKATIWTGSMKADLHGNIAGIVVEGFCFIMGGPAAREEALKLMQERHEKMKAAGR